jgi:hypothetical protein
MYSGRLMDELMQMVERAEEHAQELKTLAVQPEPIRFYAPQFPYEKPNQQVYVGVA